MVLCKKPLSHFSYHKNIVGFTKRVSSANVMMGGGRPPRLRNAQVAATFDVGNAMHNGSKNIIARQQQLSNGQGYLGYWS